MLESTQIVSNGHTILLEVWLTTLFALVILGGMTFVANKSDDQPAFRILLYLGILGFNGLLIVYPLLAAASPTPDTDPIATRDLVASIVLGVAAAIICTVFLWLPARQWAARFFPKVKKIVRRAADFPAINLLRGESIEVDPFIDKFRKEHDSFIGKFTPLEHSEGGFRPESMVHMWAWVAIVYFLAFQLMSFFLAGGLSGVAEDIAINYSNVLANFLPLIIIPFMGVGLFMRRDLRGTLKRLGLEPITLSHILISIGTTFGLICVVFMISIIWAGLVSEETLEAQTEASNALAESINSFGLVLLVALTAGIGEEVAFRGAMQPIFGFWFTAVVFVLSHTQYTLTPASLIILVVALAFGVIRQRINTTAAILTHFLYDFALLLLALAANQVSWLHFIL